MARSFASALPTLPRSTLEARSPQAVRPAYVSCLTYKPPGHRLWFLRVKSLQGANRVPRSRSETPRPRKTHGARSEGRGVEQGADVVALVSLQHGGLGIQRVVDVQRDVETLSLELRAHV